MLERLLLRVAFRCVLWCQPTEDDDVASASMHLATALHNRQSGVRGGDQ